MKEQIGQVAGQVWSVLGQKGEVELSQLPRFIKQKSEVVYQALGWLAREEKIKYTPKGSKSFIALSDSELGIFKTIN